MAEKDVLIEVIDSAPMRYYQMPTTQKNKAMRAFEVSYYFFFGRDFENARKWINRVSAHLGEYLRPFKHMDEDDEDQGWYEFMRKMEPDDKRCDAAVTKILGDDMIARIIVCAEKQKDINKRRRVIDEDKTKKSWNKAIEKLKLGADIAQYLNPYFIPFEAYSTMLKVIAISKARSNPNLPGNRFFGKGK